MCSIWRTLACHINVSDSSAANRLYAHSTTYEDLHEQLKRLKEEGIFEPDMGKSWKVIVDGINNRITDKRMRDVVMGLGFIGLDGKIALKNPDVELVVLEDCE